MSIEERAEEKAKLYAIDNYEECMYDDTKGWENDYKARKEAYNAGYITGYNDAQKENGIVWHKVADGLPISDEDKIYLVKDKWNCYAIARYFNGKWSNYVTIENVIAWCEIPRFTE